MSCWVSHNITIHRTLARLCVYCGLSIQGMPDLHNRRSAVEPQKVLFRSLPVSTWMLLRIWSCWWRSEQTLVLDLNSLYSVIADNVICATYETDGGDKKTRVLNFLTSRFGREVFFSGSLVRCGIVTETSAFLFELRLYFLMLIAGQAERGPRKLMTI